MFSNLDLSSNTLCKEKALVVPNIIMRLSDVPARNRAESCALCPENQPTIASCLPLIFVEMNIEILYSLHEQKDT
jgi:hypothetical protein